jgi:hypothetical protein
VGQWHLNPCWWNVGLLTCIRTGVCFINAESAEQSASVGAQQKTKPNLAKGGCIWGGLSPQSKEGVLKPREGSGHDSLCTCLRGRRKQTWRTWCGEREPVGPIILHLGLFYFLEAW